MKDFKLAAIVNFGIDTGITAEELEAGQMRLCWNERLYNEAVDQYRRKTDAMIAKPAGDQKHPQRTGWTYRECCRAVYRW